MKRKKFRYAKYTKPKKSAAEAACARCVFNEYRRCGVLFCTLPRCCRSLARGEK